MVDTYPPQPELPLEDAEPIQLSVEPKVEQQVARLRRVSDYLTSSLAKADPLEANIGSINSGLMRLALSLDDIIERAVGAGPQTVEGLENVMPAIDTHLRVTRQVDRFAQLELRSHEARQPKVKKFSSQDPDADPLVEEEQSE